MADGTILDGHQRYKAVQELGREIPEDKIVTHPEIDTLQKAKEFVVRSEIRGHPRPYERCLLAYKVY